MQSVNVEGSWVESGWGCTVAVGGGGGVAGVAVAGLGDGDGDGGGRSAGLAALQEGRVAQGPLEPHTHTHTHQGSRQHMEL